MEVERRRKLREKRPDMESKQLLDKDMRAYEEAQARRMVRRQAVTQHIQAERDAQVRAAREARELEQREQQEHDRHALESARRAEEVRGVVVAATVLRAKLVVLCLTGVGSLILN